MQGRVWLLLLLISLVWVNHATRQVSRHTSSSSSSLRSVFNQVWTKAVRQSLREQEAEDLNALHRIDSHLSRRLLVMPLSEQFRPNAADPMHGKVHFGDKCSLPMSLGRLLFERRLEVPWLFELVPVRSVGSERIDRLGLGSSCLSGEDVSNSGEEVDGQAPHSVLDKVYLSPLDFRAPENFIFLPQWMMKDLGLRTNDFVDISFVRIKLAALVVLQPLTLEWDNLIKKHSDPKPLLEHEINKYASLTAGSTITISIDENEYSFRVKETVAEGGIKVHGVRVQDSDIHTDIDRSVLDELLAAHKEHN